MPHRYSGTAMSRGPPDLYSAFFLIDFYLFI